VLKALVFAESERVASAALDGALAAELPADRRAAHALKLIDAVDPMAAVTATMTSLPSTPEGVDSLSLSQLLHIVEQHDSEASPST
jgi:hypothetical protein